MTKLHWILVLAIFTSAGCANKSLSTTVSSKDDLVVPFQIFGSHMVLVSVKVNDESPTTFIFDTGIGPNMVSKSYCEKLGCKYTGTLRGKRMSGQELVLPTAILEKLAVGPFVKKNVEVAVWDTSSFPKELSHVQGFVSPIFFADTPFTMDYFKKEIRAESNESMAARLASGEVSELRVVKDGPSVQLFTKINIHDGSIADVEIDTGSNSLILNEVFMAKIVSADLQKTLKKTEGKDESGHSFTRYFGLTKGTINPLTAKSFVQSDPNVMFQKIIYDGLLGTNYLRQYCVTYDLTGQRMVLNKCEQ